MSWQPPGDAGQTLYRIFSDPRSTFCGGRVCGNATNADNARTLTQTIPTVATFRASVSPAPSGRVLLRSLDTNGNGKSDLLLFNHGASRVVDPLYGGADAAAVRRMQFQRTGCQG